MFSTVTYRYKNTYLLLFHSKLILQLIIYLIYLSANHSDGQYQTRGFKTALSEVCGIDNNIFQFPEIWDAAHWADLAVKGLREKGNSSAFFNKFLERCNSFHSMFGHGRGFEEYAASSAKTGLHGTCTAGYSGTRYFENKFQHYLAHSYLIDI